MKRQLPLMRPAPLPAAQLALEAYWHVARHPSTYGGQILVLSVFTCAMQLATGIVAFMLTTAASGESHDVVLQLVYLGTLVTMLVLGGTGIFISCQRAIVLDQAPAVNHALRLQRADFGALRAVCVYWLIVHLVPTFVVHAGYLAPQLGLRFPQLSMLGNFAFYWAWVLATAPLVVLSLPIALFEGADAPLAQGKSRLSGNAGRLSAAAALALTPLGILDMLLYWLRDRWGPLDDNLAGFWIVDVLLMPILQAASSYAIILVMSALVASAYVRLSPRLDGVYRVFD